MLIALRAIKIEPGDHPHVTANEIEWEITEDSMPNPLAEEEQDKEEQLEQCE